MKAAADGHRKRLDRSNVADREWDKLATLKVFSQGGGGRSPSLAERHHRWIRRSAITTRLGLGTDENRIRFRDD